MAGPRLSVTIAFLCFTVLFVGCSAGPIGSAPDPHIVANSPIVAEQGDGGGYYSWNPKVNTTETNKTINYTEVLEETEEVTFEEEVIVEESKPSWFWRITGAVILLIIIVIIIYLINKE